MAAFVVRRFIGMILVLVAVSFFVFVIFIVVPGGDPAMRIAGKNATDQNIENIRQTWGFDQPFYVAVLRHDEEDVHGRPRTSSTQPGRERRGADQGRRAGDVLARDRRRHHLAVLRDPRRRDLGGHRGPVVGPRYHAPRADRHLDAGVLARDPRALLPRRGRTRESSPTAATSRSPRTRRSGSAT